MLYFPVTAREEHIFEEREKERERGNEERVEAKWSFSGSEETCPIWEQPV